MKTTINRRSMIAGTAALSASLTGAAAATLTHAPHPDAALLAACREWWADQAIHEKLWDAVGLADDEAEALYPPVPPELSEHVPVEGQPSLEPSGGEWRTQDIEQRIAAASGVDVGVDTINPRKRVMIVEEYDYPQATMDRLHELLSVSKDHEQRVKAIMAASVLAEDRAEETASRQGQRCKDIVSIPARTLEGLLAKAKVLQKEGRVFSDHDLSVNDPDEARQIFADIEALALGRT